MNLWGHNLLEQWKTKINITPISETNYNLTYASEKNIKRYYQEQTTQVVYKQDTTATDLSNLPITLFLKWLTDKPVWVEQRPMTPEKLQALEQLVQEQLNAQHIEELTSPWNSPKDC